MQTPSALLPAALAVTLISISERVDARASADADAERVRTFVDEHCVRCHDPRGKKGGLDLESVLSDEFGRHPQTWEKVARKLSVRQMPPFGRPRPDNDAYDAVTAILEDLLDAAATTCPDPGRTETFRRLTRTEYRNAIRDLLALDIDTEALLPPDSASHGFDNVTVSDLSPTLLDRYVTVAEKISRLAVGGKLDAPLGHTIRLPPDRTQEGHVEGLPLGTRGGALVPYTFPIAGDYEIEIRLARDRDELVEGLKRRHQVEVLLDRKLVKSFQVEPPKDGDHSKVDTHLNVRVPVSAGPHDLGVTFVKESSSLIETRRQPYLARFNRHRHPRLTPAVFQISITGPFTSQASPEATPDDTPSRRRIFVCRPTVPQDEEGCARRILSRLMRLAYRRSVTEDDLIRPMMFFREARAGSDFEGGIQMALSSVLVSPRFLFRVEQDPAGIAPNTAYRVNDVQLASRLSFFLWSSLPDEALLDAAERGELSDPDVLKAQVERMLGDPRSSALVENFASQWLHLRNLRSTRPDGRLFPDFDDNLRQALRRETDLFVNSVFRGDGSVLDLLQANYTFLNERLAKHYGIPHVHGSRFRRVELDAASRRGGLLRHGSLLAVTSYATRTSPVIRGRWVLENLLGAPPPPPPPDVPALEDNDVDASLPLRARLEEHRRNAACSGCHAMMDPVGLAFENYDAVGRWRTLEAGKPVDASGGLPGFGQFEGVEGLERSLLSHPEIFVRTLVEKLLTFALGRGVEYRDAPAIRKIVRNARAEQYRFSTLLLEIVKSTPFQMRKAR